MVQGCTKDEPIVASDKLSAERPAQACVTSERSDAEMDSHVFICHPLYFGNLEKKLPEAI